MTKQRIHSEWFQPIKKKTCPCGTKKTEVFSWGEYGSGLWRTIEHFCKDCFAKRIIPQLVSHAKDCGCGFSLQSRAGYSIPNWIKMPISKQTTRLVNSGSYKSSDTTENNCPIS